MSKTSIGTSNFTKFDDRFYGNYRALVQNNDDPLQAGRIQATVYPMMKDITPTTILPWAVPAYPISSGSGSGFGSFAVPEIGSWVWVFFEAGNIYQPVYFAEAPTATLGIPADATTSYPFSKILRTKNGIEVAIDDKQQIITVLHPSGTYIKIDKLGNVIISGTNVNINANSVIQLNAPEVETSGNLIVSTGDTGVFASADGQLITVADGIITNID